VTDAPTGGPRGEVPRTGPNGERLMRCRSCSAWIYWAETPAGKRVPIALATGESHFKDCPFASSHSRRRRKPT
jgi:hypothetical protein